MVSSLLCEHNEVKKDKDAVFRSQRLRSFVPVDFFSFSKFVTTCCNAFLVSSLKQQIITLFVTSTFKNDLVTVTNLSVAYIPI